MEEIEAEAMRLDPRSRARLAEKLLRSLEELGEEENEAIWAEEAGRRDANADSDRTSLRPVGDVLRDARSKLS